MARDPFWITDLHRDRDIEITVPLSEEAVDFLREVHTRGTTSKTAEGRRVECRAHDNDGRLAEFRDADGRVHDIWMYVKERNGRLLLCHYPFDRKDVRLADHDLTDVEGPAHRLLKDIWQQAYEDGGCTVQQERRLGNRQFDVCAERNGNLYVVESDHTTRSLATARRKWDSDRALGVAATLFCADRPNPPYANRVPHTEVNELPIRRPHPRHLPIARGPRVIEFLRCRAGGPWQRCPELPKGSRATYCGKEHPWFTPWVERGSLTVGDVGERLPIGDLVIVRPGRQRIEACVVSAEDGRALDEYLDGAIAPLHDDPATRTNPHTRVVTAEEMAARVAVPAPRQPSWGEDRPPATVGAHPNPPLAGPPSRATGQCERCGRPGVPDAPRGADRLIHGRCVRCAYPGGDAPD
ncbi:hypothetical protein [Actinomycetospora cinnamomea]|uniref:Uncharacterized protein n=1 Tax=Actinomycetospora cinnamomea TaxID=663609 RepID=A0A2U1FA55_9PSEU|nr:hypothetical protein [Actinomycetospora cinnamomea]PVZ09065.1 hypothetical protein C8D89_107229 [Actinomycetospora cinnamomea]